MAKLVRLKMLSRLDFEVDIAYTLAEAELFTRKYNYFIAILDLNLPDAPNGEVVDVMIKKGVPSIVMTGAINKEFRAQILKKDIIDYVGKEGMENIDYIISTIDRLSKNRRHKVLVVEDSMVFRNQMKKMVKNLFFQVFAVAHGEEALSMIEQERGIRIVITDYNMPVMDGLELTKEIRKNHPKEEMAIFVLSASNDSDTSAMFLKRGATDYITKPYSKEELSCRLNNAIEALENIDKITNFSVRDFLTGLYNRRYFFQSMEPYFAEAAQNEEGFVTAMIDIDHFKKINDTYGHDAGDKAIVHLADILRSSVQSRDIVARFGGEEFCVVLKEIGRDEAMEVFERIRHRVEITPLRLDAGQELIFSISIGVALEPENTLAETVNDADMKLYNAKSAGRNRICYA